jgi:hypothetical protein
LENANAAVTAAALARARQEDGMTVALNKTSFEFAKRLVKGGHYVIDDRDAWSEHLPSRTAQKNFIEEHGLREFGKWHLGEDDEIEETSMRRYKFPYGDFKNVHRCAVLSAESRAGQYKYFDIELAAAHLHGMLEELKAA